MNFLDALRYAGCLALVVVAVLGLILAALGWAMKDPD